jgi:hypothetical protein
MPWSAQPPVECSTPALIPVGIRTFWHWLAEVTSYKRILYDMQINDVVSHLQQEYLQQQQQHMMQFAGVCWLTGG